MAASRRSSHQLLLMGSGARLRWYACAAQSESSSQLFGEHASMSVLGQDTDRRHKDGTRTEQSAMETLCDGSWLELRGGPLVLLRDPRRIRRRKGRKRLDVALESAAKRRQRQPTRCGHCRGWVWWS